MPATKSTVRRIWKALGPGLTTGAADDDPSGIATYSQAGAQFGFALTWTMLLTPPFMAAIQIIRRLQRLADAAAAAVNEVVVWMQAPRASLRDSRDVA